MAHEETTAQRLELRNQAALIRSAQEKLRNGKTLTKREIAAVAEAEQRKAEKDKPPDEPRDVARYGEAYRCMTGVAAPPIESVRMMLGTTIARTLQEVANAFGMSANTVTQSWRQAGMPGAVGKYDLAEILTWRLRHDLENARFKGATAGTSTDRLRQLEIEKKEIENQQLKDQFLARQGQMIPLQQAQAELYANIAIAKEALLGVPRALAPMLPSKLAPTVTRECEKLIRHALGSLASGRVCGISPAKLVPRVQELLSKYGMNGKSR